MFYSIDHRSPPPPLLLTKKDKYSDYDYPKFPPRPVSPNFFKTRTMPRPPKPKLEIVNIKVEPKMKKEDVRAAQADISKMVKQVKPSISSIQNEGFDSDKLSKLNALKLEEQFAKLDGKPKQEDHKKAVINVASSMPTDASTKNCEVKMESKSGQSKVEKLNESSTKVIEKLKRRSKKISSSEDESDEYEHIYCEIDSKPVHKPDQPPNSVSYINSGKKASAIMDFQPLQLKAKQNQPLNHMRVPSQNHNQNNNQNQIPKSVNVNQQENVQSNIKNQSKAISINHNLLQIPHQNQIQIPHQNQNHPIRPSRSKVFKKAISLDSEDSRIHTPASKLLDRPTPASQQLDRPTPASKLLDRPTPASKLLDRPTPAKHLFDVGAPAQLVFDRGVGSRSSGSVLPRLRSASGDQGTNLERPRLASSEAEKRRSFHQCPSAAIPDKLSAPDLPERICSKETSVKLDNCNGLKPTVVAKKFDDISKSDHSKVNEKTDSHQMAKTTNVEISKKEKDFKTSKQEFENLSENRKRRSGHFDETDNPKSLKVKDPKGSSNKVKPEHSKLTKSEEKYIADLLMAKTFFPEKEASKIKVPKSSTAIEEERKKGAIRDQN